MRREQLEHAIRTACQIIERPEVIVVGPIAHDNDDTARLADQRALAWLHAWD